MVFEQANVLQERINVLTDEVKTYCKQNKRSLETDLLCAEFGTSKSRWYDPTTIRQYVSADLIRTMDVIKVEETVDEAVLKMLIKAKKIHEDVLKAAYREEETASRVTIKRKDS
jgi:hypothetical protein